MTSPVPVMISEDSRSATASNRLQAPQHPVGTPVLGELHGRASRFPWCFSSFASKRSNSRKRVGRPSGEAGEDAVVIKAPHLAPRSLSPPLGRA